MHAPLDFTGQIGADGWSRAAVDRFLAYGRLRGRVLPAGATVDLHVTAGDPERTPAQNRLWWALLGDLADRLNKAGWRTPSGREAHKDGLHLWAKWNLLPGAAADYWRETGETVDYERVIALPGGEEIVTYTTKHLPKGCFSLLVDALLSEDLSKLAGMPEGEYRDAVAKVRGGAIHERDELRLAPVPDAVATVTRPAAVPSTVPPVGAGVRPPEEGDGLSDAGRIQAQLAEWF